MVLEGEKLGEREGMEGGSKKGSKGKKDELFHVIHKVPAGDSPYVRAKYAQLIEKDPESAILLFWEAINSGDRVESALKDLAVVMKQVDRAEEAIHVLKTFRFLCSKDSQESLDNVLIDLFKKCGRIEEQIELLKRKLRMIYQGEAFNGKPTRTARSHGKKFQVSVKQETSRLLFQSLMAEKEKPKIITDKNQMRTWTRAMRSQGKTIALVPTMGFLHDGHLSLIEEAHKHTQLVVVSIYVNPSQFAPSEDLSTYPSDFEGDIRKLMAVPGGIDAVFHPHNLYDYGVESAPDCGGNGGGSGGSAAVSCLEESGSGHETWVRVERLEKGMCGRSRPVFFRGVSTIVTKLFNIVEPDVAVFGKKDYQQWRIIKRMVRDLDFSINIVGSEIVRDADGLAMSSRNVHLSPAERQKALSINRSLSKAKSAAERGELNCKRLKNWVIDEIREAGGELDYAEIVEQESLEVVEEIKSPVVILIAAWFGKVRLIDNMEINI